MEEYDSISAGMEVHADDYLKVNKVNSGGVAIARHVEVKEITSGGLVICETASNIETISSGGTLICRNLDSINYNPRETDAFHTLGAYLSYLKNELQQEDVEAFQESTEQDIDQLLRLINDIELEV